MPSVFVKRKHKPKKHHKTPGGSNENTLSSCACRIGDQLCLASFQPAKVTQGLEPVGPVLAYWGTYTVDDAAKTYTIHIERCTFPQWDEGERILNLAFPTENELNTTNTKPIPDPKMGPFVPQDQYSNAIAVYCIAGCIRSVAFDANLDAILHLAIREN